MKAVAAGGALVAALVFALGAPAALPGKPGRIAFTSDRDGLPSVYTMNGDGSDVRRVTNTGAHSEGRPVWSPDGSRIAFVSEAPPPDPAPPYVTSAIYVVNADGTNLVRVTPLPSGALSRPSWSPDGSKIVYSTGVDGEATIHVINLDGSSDVQLTRPALSAEGPVWSPDGQRIAFSALPGGVPWETCLMRADGSHVHCLRHHGWQELEQSWSPNGRRLLVSATNPKGHGGTMFVMNADGTHRLNLSQRFGPGFYPSFSPDGRKLLFECSSGGNIGICVGELRTGQVSYLTRGSRFDGEPDWQSLPASAR